MIDYRTYLEEVSNSVGGVELTEVPVAMKSRFAGHDEYKIPHDIYSKIRVGRARGDSWKQYGMAEEQQASIQKSLYKNGSCLITSDSTGASYLMRHQRIQRVLHDHDTDADV